MIIPDTKVPIFIPYGYRGIGKTMLIQRLMRYLTQQGFIVRPELVFLNAPGYSRVCERYMEEALGGNVAAATAINEPVLISVEDCNGMTLCYLLDMSGELQYNVKTPHAGVSAELQELMHNPNPKIWGFLIDNGDSLALQQRQGYVLNIRNLAPNILTPKDNVLLIYNKVHQTRFIDGHGQVMLRHLFEDADIIYPGIFKPFEIKNNLLRVLKGKYCFRMTPFQTGDFHETRGNILFMSGKDEYPKQLWSNIMKCIR